MLAKDTICAEMAFMLMERNRPGSSIDYPLQGSRGIVDALVRGTEKHGGRLLLRARVQDILIEGAPFRQRPSLQSHASFSMVK
jgi:phytoene dehydrogenase-like protein